MSVLSMWTIYDRPDDYPRSVVARKWVIDDGDAVPTGDLIVSPDIPSCRESLRRLDPSLTRLNRLPQDEPHIVENWL
jgi:hypothetical protein